LSSNLQARQLYFDRYGFVSGTDRDLKSGAIIVALQFNPFQLNAVKYIVEMDVSNWENFGYVVGKYRIKGREYLFNYDINDIRFRMHSDVWMKNVKLDSESKYFYSKFDMVSTRKFDGWMQNFGEGVLLNTNIIGSMVSDRVPHRGYSVIGPWFGYLRPGHSENFYGPAITSRLRRDASSKVRFKVMSYEYLMNIIRLPDGRELKLKKGKVQDNNFFVRYNPANEGMIVNGKFQRKKLVNGKKIRKNEVAGLLYERSEFGEESYYEVPFRVKNMPQNRYGSLIPSLRVVSLLLVAEEIKKPEIDRKMDIFLWAGGEGHRKIDLEDVPDVMLETNSWSRYINAPRVVKLIDESVKKNVKRYVIILVLNPRKLGGVIRKKRVITKFWPT